MPIEIDAIIAKMEWVATRGLREFAVQVSGAHIHIRRSGLASAHSATEQTEMPEKQVPIAKFTSNTTPSNVLVVDAPLAGICHLSGDSDSAPFVSVGDKITVGQTVCMIEAMKVMTSVTVAAGGTVSAILIEDGSSVDAGAALIEVQA